MKIYNKKIAAAFIEIADLMGILGEGFFKIRAYREAARVLTEEAEPITKKNADEKEFLQITRIGKALAAKMMEFIETGHMRLLNDLRLEVPKSVRALLKIPGLGPGRIGKLFLLAGITTKRQLIKAAKNDELLDLPGFGQKSIDKIMMAIELDQQKKKRHNRKTVTPIAKKLTTLLKKIKGIRSVDIAGSYRRGNKTIGDLDLLIVAPKTAATTTEKLITKTYPHLTILVSGETKISFIILPQNLQVDVRFVPEESYGAALLYFTGSKNHNIMMRKAAIEQGYLLNEYGLFKEGEYVAGETEEGVFKKLNLPVRPPEQRK